MRIGPVNPFLVFVVVALIVLVASVVISHRRSKTPSATTRPRAPGTPVVVLAVAVILVPFGIAIAAIWGPSVGIMAYCALLAGALIGRALSRRSRD